jgi:pyridoxal phosphate enzyme (YggS family)
MSIASQLIQISNDLPRGVRLVAVSKLHTPQSIMEAYKAGQRIFGENRVQELLPKQQQLPQDIQWHFIGHLQVNKVKSIVPFIDTIHSVDSWKLLHEINKEAAKNDRKINVLLQIHIAQEEHKFGFTYDEIEKGVEEKVFDSFTKLRLSGLMGMATFTDDENRIRKEFHELSSFFRRLKAGPFAGNNSFCELSMGMSGDYPIAIEEGSTLVRIGSKLFGK